MRQTRKQVLTSFSQRATAIGARYAILFVYTEYNPQQDQPYQCFYRLPSGELTERAAPGYSPAEALSNLEEALWQAYHSHLIFSLQ